MAHQFRYEFTDGRITSFSFLNANAPADESDVQVLPLPDDEAATRLREMMTILCSKTWTSERECSQALMRIAGGA